MLCLKINLRQILMDQIRKFREVNYNFNERMKFLEQINEDIRKSLLWTQIIIRGQNFGRYARYRK